MRTMGGVTTGQVCPWCGQRLEPGEPLFHPTGSDRWWHLRCAAERQRAVEADR
ncbi:MAG TPA: hypothetical protein VFJ14_01805 [Nocardioidaceae bacterium]|nr:hypothetical protein [Nocardioidaceae bacterium]